MNIELSEERKQKLDKLFEKEISDYQNKIICKEKFIYLIKEKCKIMEFCYLYQTYIGHIESIRRIPTIEDFDHFIEINDKEEDNYNNKFRSRNYSHRNTRKLVKIEKIAHKKTNYKQHK